jgi:hypothetical protein
VSTTMCDIREREHLGPTLGGSSSAGFELTTKPRGPPKDSLDPFQVPPHGNATLVSEASTKLLASNLSRWKYLELHQQNDKASSGRNLFRNATSTQHPTNNPGTAYCSSITVDFERSNKIPAMEQGLGRGCAISDTGPSTVHYLSLGFPYSNSR